MSSSSAGRSVAGSMACQCLIGHVEQAGGSGASVNEILWRIGGHPLLVAHARIFRHVAAALRSEVFSEQSLHWAGPWREKISVWLDTLALVERLEPQLRADPSLREMFREPRDADDHPLLRQGVGRHPLAAAMFNIHECAGTSESGIGQQAADRYALARAHVMAIYTEARQRAAAGLEQFLVHDGEREFSAVPLGAGPVGLALRELSLADYAPLVAQLPGASSTPEFAYRVSTIEPDFSALPRALKDRAARHLIDLQRYLSALASMLSATQLQPRTRHVEDVNTGPGGHAHRPGWVGWAAGAIRRYEEHDWADDAPPLIHISLPAPEELDPLVEETEGDAPGSTRDNDVRLYDPASRQKKMSAMRFVDLHLERRHTHFPWALSAASSTERNRALDVAQGSISCLLEGTPQNRNAARQAAVGGLLVKACAVYGWHPATAAAIAILRVDRLDGRTAESLLYVKQDQICLLARAPEGKATHWSPLAFLVPGIGPSYRTQLPVETEAVARPRQRCFLLPDVGGLGAELLKLAGLADRLPTAEPLVRRPLGVETKTAVLLANQCLSRAEDPINEDRRAMLTMQRLAASVQAALLAVSGDAMAGWMIMQDAGCVSEARLYYSQIRANRLPRLLFDAINRLDGDRWQHRQELSLELSTLQAGWVGCRFVADVGKVQELLRTLHGLLLARLDLTCLSAVRRYHNHLALYAWLQMALTFGLRAGTGGPSLPFLIELRQGVTERPRADAIGLADKHGGYQDKSRLLPLTPAAMAAAARLSEHNAAVIQRLDLHQDWLALNGSAQRHFVFDDKKSIVPLTAGWIKDRLAELGFPAPPNFARALIRTEWADRGSSAHVIDPFLGHFSSDQNWFAKHSSHDPSGYLKQVTPQLQELSAELNLHPVPSQCLLMTRSKATELTPELPQPRIGLNFPAARSVVQPIWWKTNVDPPLPDELLQMWKEVRRQAAVSDRPLVTSLLWLLRNSNCHHAQVLTRSLAPSALTLDAASAESLEDEVLLTAARHELPRTVAASWLRLLRAAQERLPPAFAEMVVTKTMALTTNPESPVSTRLTMALPDIHCWQAALHSWIRDHAGDTDPRTWAIAVGLSAVIHGMALDMRLLSSIMQRLAEPGLRRLQLCGGHDGLAFMEFQLPSAVPGRRQCTRWFPDALTELLILNAPPFPVTPELGSTSRYIAPFLRHHGAAEHRCPGGWRTVIRAARALWSTRVPQHVVNCATRGISATSLEPACWQRLFGGETLVSDRSGAQLAHSLPPQSEWLTYDDLTYDPEDDSADSPAGGGNPLVGSKWQAAGRQIDHVRLDILAAHTWLHQADAAMRLGHDDVVRRLLELREQHQPGTFAHGALGWMEKTARELMKPDERDLDVMLGLRRAVSTLLPRLAAEAGDTWISAMPAGERAQVLDGVAHELESAVSRPDLKRGLALLHRHDEGARAAADFGDDIENPDLDARVDARMITVDEYMQALDVIRSGISPPLRPSEREALEDLLHLAVWTLARPREYMEARVGDFEFGDHGEVDLTIREYTGHSLKTKQATRRVPLGLLASAEVCERIQRSVRERVASSGLQGENARRLLFFAAPEGQAARAHHDHLLSLMRQVLRRVTGDPEIRVYSLRHASANWLYLALEGDGSAVWSRLWAAHPLMLAYLQAGDGLRNRLLGNADRTDRRALLSITLLQGHLAVATTFMHYVHTTCLLQLQSVYRFAEDVPRAVLAAAAQAKAANFSEQMANGLAGALPHARRRAGWTPTPPPKAVAGMRETEATAHNRWLLFSDIQLLLDAHAAQRQPLTYIARHFGVTDGFVKAALETSAGLAGWVGATAQPIAGEALPATQMPSARMNEAERVQLDHLVRNIEAAWRGDPTLVVNAVGLVFDRTTRLHHELTLCDPEQLTTALTFLCRCGVGPEDLQFVVRRRTGRAEVPCWAKPLLGRFEATPIKVLPPDTKASEASLARWLRIRVVDRKGQAIPQVMARAVFTAWVNMTAAPQGDAAA